MARWGKGYSLVRKTIKCRFESGPSLHMLAKDLIILTRDEAEILVLCFRPKDRKAIQKLVDTNVEAWALIERLRDEIKSLDGDPVF